MSVHHMLILQAKRIIKLLTPSGSRTILCFPYQTLWQYSDETPPPYWGIEYRRAISRFILEMIQDGAIVTIECEAFEWYHFQ